VPHFGGFSVKSLASTGSRCPVGGSLPGFRSSVSPLGSSPKGAAALLTQVVAPVCLVIAGRRAQGTWHLRRRGFTRAVATGSALVRAAVLGPRDASRRRQGRDRDVRRDGSSARRAEPEEATEVEKPDEEDEAASVESLPALEKWRRRPKEFTSEKSVNEGEVIQVVFGDLEDSYQMGKLSRNLPIRSLALIGLRLDHVPSVGQLSSVRLSRSSKASGWGSGSPDQLAALDHAVDFTGGLLGCVVHNEDATGLPWGGTACEVVSILHVSEDEVLVNLRGVTSVRLVSVQPVKQAGGVTLASVQEVPDWGSKDRVTDVDKVRLEVKRVEELWQNCAELQKRSEFFAPGDFTSLSLEERVEQVQAILEGRNMLHADGSVETSPMLRKAAATAHAVVVSLSPPSREEFLCDPVPALPRLTRAVGVLQRVEKLLRARIAFRRAFEEESEAPSGTN